MLTELSAQDLADALTSVRNSLAQTPLFRVIDLYLTSIYSRGTIINDSASETQSLRELIRRYSTCVTPDTLELLDKIPIFCHALPICNAVARRSAGGDPFVLIYSGLLSVAKYRLSLAILISNLEFMLEQKSNDVTRAKKALSEIAAPAQALSYWYYVMPSTLPEFADIFCEPHKAQVEHGLGSATLFVALHEIGHIRLGHIDGGRSPIPQILNSYVEERFDELKMLEFAADEFAIRCIKPTLQMSFLTSIFIILDLISDVECYCLPRGESHPYVINRVNNIASILELENDEFYFTRTHSLLSQKKSLLVERAKAFPALIDGDVSDRMAAIATDTFKRLLPSREECLVALDTLKAMYDGVDYIGPHVAAE
jgi:hypothetical protein